MARYDSSRFKIDPHVAQGYVQANSRNWGQDIGQMFTELGKIADQKFDRDQKSKYDEIKLTQIRDELEDDKRLVDFALAEDKNEFIKNNPFKTSKYQLKTLDFTNSLDEKSQMEHYKRASTLFTGEDGTFDRKGAFNHLATKLKNKEINEATFFNITDSINKQTKQGIYSQESKDFAPTAEIKNYNAYAESMKANGLEPEPYFQWFKNKDLNKNMGMGVKDINYANEAVSNALATNDKSKKIEAANIYSNIIKDAKEVDKYFRSLAPTIYQLNEAQKIVEKGGAGVADEIKNQFSTWTGLGWDDTTQEGRTAFLSVLQPLAKASMTGTISDRDMKTLESSFTTLYKSDKALANALKNKTEQLLYTAEQYEQRHPNYVKLTGYDKNMQMLRAILNIDPDGAEVPPPKPKIIIDRTNESKNKPSWKDYE